MESRGNFSFIDYIDSEFRRGYHLEYDRERFASRRNKIYTFLKIPFEVEKLMIFGYFHCADSFLFILTFLPIRFIVALGKSVSKIFCLLFTRENAQENLLRNMEIIDLIKGSLIVTCCYVATFVDSSMLYHLIKTQSAVKLYIFFNMLEIADKLMSAFGQDTLDALFWTATGEKQRKRDYFLLCCHLLIATLYICIHSGIILLQALVLSVAINAENKGLLTIVVSNNFIEIKGAVFKKYDRNNLLQIACSDVRERFHQGVLMFVVIMLTMKEYSWREDRFYEILYICFIVIIVEVFIDWLKHAFIIRFNEIPVDVYKDYRLLIASDLVMCKKNQSFSDHSDLVARRMGFIPLPLGVIVFRILSQTLKFNNYFSFLLLFMGYLCLLSFRIFNSILILALASLYINGANLNRTSECEKKDSAWRMAVDSYCERVHTPIRSRRRTASKEDKSENVVRQRRNTIQDSDSTKSLVPSDDPEEKSNNSEVTLTFLGESRANLLSNSMLNLVEVGMDDPGSSSDEEDFEIMEMECVFNDDIKSNKNGIDIISESIEPTCDSRNNGNGIIENLNSYITEINEIENNILSTDITPYQTDLLKSDISTIITTDQGSVLKSNSHGERDMSENNVLSSVDNGDPIELAESKILPILRKGVLVSDATQDNLIPTVSHEKSY